QVEDMLWLEEWCHFLNCPPTMDIAFLEGKANSEAVRSACICVARSQLNERDMSLYEASEKRQLDWASSIHAAEQEGKATGRKEGEQVGLKKGKEQGRKEGKKEGRKEGEQAGLKKGKEQGRKEGEQVGLEKGKEESKVEIATQMLLAHLPSEQVCALTGLDTAKVVQLAEQLGQ
ncbi:MAG: hypothetical protein AAF706_00950, partial [Bacteroidota bacterium]